MNDLAIESALEKGLEPNTEDNYEMKLVWLQLQKISMMIRKQNANDGYDRFFRFWNGYYV